MPRYWRIDCKVIFKGDFERVMFRERCLDVGKREQCAQRGNELRPEAFAVVVVVVVVVALPDGKRAEVPPAP